MPTNNPAQPEHYDIFISYRTTRRPWVEVLAKNLQSQGYKVFLDCWAMIAGDNYTPKIFNALKYSRYALLIATPESAESGWVQEEYEYMFNLSKQREDFHWIPVVLGEFPDFPFISNIQAVDFQDNSEEKYRIAFQKLLCGLNRQAPGEKPYFSGELALPKPETKPDLELHTLAANKQNFIKDVWSRLDASIPLMILAQADTNTQHYIQALKHSLQQCYPNTAFIHMFPPASVRVDRSGYFGRLAKQCGFENFIGESWEWADAFREKLEKDEEFILLITGFENGSDETRSELAGELRGLLDCFPYKIKLIILGSEKLAAAKYLNSLHSLLNSLDEIRIPEIGKQDLESIYLNRYKTVSIDEKTIDKIFLFTGKHPRLIERTLQLLEAGDQHWSNSIEKSILPSQLFSRFMNESNTLSKYLHRENLGRNEAWPEDEFIRRLYWQNLITVRNGCFVWRCEFIRKYGTRLISANN